MQIWGPVSPFGTFSCLDLRSVFASATTGTVFSEVLLSLFFFLLLIMNYVRLLLIFP
jgi:hypothetical protein